MTAYITGVGYSEYTRRPDADLTTSSILAQAGAEAIAEAGLTPGDIDGFGVASFTLRPDHAIDQAWRMGLSVKWLMDDANGGASAGSMLQHAVHAIDAGTARNILLVAGDLMAGDAFRSLVAEYNSATAHHLTPLPMSGPNALFAMLTQRQMEECGLRSEDYGRIAIAQREWAGLNPRAVYQEPLTMEQYLTAPVVADPLRRFDCVPPVSGGEAIVVSANPDGRAAVRVLSTRSSFNYDDQEGSGTATGVAEIATECWAEADIEPRDVGIVSVYDDYPAMVVAQLIDLGFVEKNHSVSDFISDRIASRSLPVNTSGGQLSAGQAGAAGGMHGLAETATQLLGRAGARQVEARYGVVTGYGMVLYRYGACATTTILEAVR
ncbi:thiolase family protein [Leucobacter sp. USHLN153]|uniref:thiolase family protein n=1 Tax=Leucobacter sp. USHLN153 TaxID=3081268 RepID=UPI00301923EF